MSGLDCVTTLIYDDAPSCYQMFSERFIPDRLTTLNIMLCVMSVGYEAGKMDVVFVRLI